MDKSQIAFELSKIAIEKGVIKFDSTQNPDTKQKEDSNSFNANQILNFYNTLLSGIKQTSN